jgi:phage tail sheath protein FI
MATSYKTPGVYVEEIPKLPPSVAQVETAIPAFIGYTQIAMNLAPGDLNNVPKRIGSLVDYEHYFGVGPSPAVTRVDISDANSFVSATVSNKFYLYDSLRMFYANGGGDCFIVSVGDYAASVDDPAFTSGITAIAKETAPTILLFPDAVTLNDSKIAIVQAAALTQCQDLQDRVTVMDVKENDSLGATFRSNVGINFLNYGAAYTPWLKVNLPKNVTYNDVKSVIYRSGVATTLDGLTSDTVIQNAIADLNKAFADVANIDAKTKLLSPPNGNLRVALNTLSAAFTGIGGNTNANLKAVFGYYYAIAAQIDKFIKAADPAVLTLAGLKADVIAAVTSNFNPTFKKVVGLETETAAKIGTYTATNTATTFIEASWAGVIGAAATTLIPPAAVTDTDKRLFSFNNLLPLFEEINQAYLTLIVGAAASYTKKLDESLALRFPTYKSILSGVGNSMTTMPPSGAVVGVYAATDRTRGVWKAPANISLANVIAPSVLFTKTELDNLNVDSGTGKSINAIRSFTGKGTLIYGARTLAGNDNEWRYISVRRFFNMVEESTKNATEAFVFEPNDANTWVKVQAMIENFLSTLWRQGALQGIKPEHAFYVAVGLGKTMTALDILEGRMIIEIGMAVVRPAEFIILRFSHKMAES